MFIGSIWLFVYIINNIVHYYIINDLRLHKHSYLMLIILINLIVQKINYFRIMSNVCITNTDRLVTTSTLYFVIFS